MPQERANLNLINDQCEMCTRVTIFSRRAFGAHVDIHTVLRLFLPIVARAQSDYLMCHNIVMSVDEKRLMARAFLDGR